MFQLLVLLFIIKLYARSNIFRNEIMSQTMLGIARKIEDKINHVCGKVPNINQVMLNSMIFSKSK